MNAVRKAWLRELGIERVWSAGGMPGVAALDAAAVATAKIEAPRIEAPQAETPKVAARQADSSAAPAIEAAAAERNAETAGAAAVLAPQAEIVARHDADLPEVAREVVQTVPALAPRPELSPMESWSLLQQEVRGCMACGLCKTRTQTVFGGGVRRARWMVVGEAPGEQEDKQGKPFVGKSGQLLDSMLKAVGHARDSDVFIANVIKCRPPGNRDPLPEEVASCSPYLMRQIAAVNPELILVLGRFAAQTLLGSTTPISALRGRVHEIDVDGRKVPVVASYHPAYLLRSQQEKAKAWQDLRLAASVNTTTA